MAFGFFKKAETADLILKNAKVYTQDLELPWAEAVACRDGRIIRVGSYEDMEDLEGKNTIVDDLGGATLLPGFIDMGGAPAMRVFKNAYKDFSDCETWEDLLSQISSAIPAAAKLGSPAAAGMTSLGDIFAAADESSSAEGAANLSNGDSVFGGSFDGGLSAAETAGGMGEEEEEEYDVPEVAMFAYTEGLSLPQGKGPEAARKELDEVTGAVPTMILLGRANAVVLNTAAAELATTMAGNLGIQQISLSFLVDILGVIDFDELNRSLVELSIGYGERGFTGVVNNGFVEYFDSTYTDMLLKAYDESPINQRLFGKLGMRMPSNPDILVRRLHDRETYCLELAPKINADGLLLDITDLFGLMPPEIAEDGGVTQDDTVYLDILHDQIYEEILAAADAGMNVKVCVHNKEIGLEIVKIFGEVRDKGYRKSIFTLCHDLEFDEEERANYSIGESIMEAGILGCEFTENDILPGDGGFTMNVGAHEVTRGLGANALCCSDNVTEAIDALTIDAAVELGIDKDFGSIEIGKYADFAVFEKNPLGCGSIDELRKMRAKRTYVGGDLAYDEDDAAADEWYNLIIQQQY